jgi:hypothetical protein
MKKVILLLVISTGFLNVRMAQAFLPPEFFVQSISSVGTIIAGGLAMVIVPFLMFWKYITRLAGSKKVVFFILAQSVIVVAIIGVIFYYWQYKPLYEKSHLFSGEEKMQQK